MPIYLGWGFSCLPKGKVLEVYDHNEGSTALLQGKSEIFGWIGMPHMPPSW